MLLGLLDNDLQYPGGCFLADAVQKVPLSNFSINVKDDFSERAGLQFCCHFRVLCQTMPPIPPGFIGVYKFSPVTSCFHSPKTKKRIKLKIKKKVLVCP